VAHGDEGLLRKLRSDGRDDARAVSPVESETTCSSTVVEVLTQGL